LTVHHIAVCRVGAGAEKGGGRRTEARLNNNSLPPTPPPPPPHNGGAAAASRVAPPPPSVVVSDVADHPAATDDLQSASVMPQFQGRLNQWAHWERERNLLTTSK